MHITQHGSRRATQRVCVRASFHLHVIHDVCLSVRCLSLRVSPSPVPFRRLPPHSTCTLPSTSSPMSTTPREITAAPSHNEEYCTMAKNHPPTNYVRRCNELASEELADDMNVAEAVAQDKAAILMYGTTPRSRALWVWRITAQALLLISDRQCNIETPDTTTNNLRTQARRTRQERTDPKERSQTSYSTVEGQNSEVRTSVEEEMAQLERQEEEFHDVLEGSEEDVCGQVSWEGRNRGEGDTRQVSATNQTSDTKAHGDKTGAKDDGNNGMDTGHCTRIKSRFRHLKSSGVWFLRYSTWCGTWCFEKSNARMQLPWQCWHPRASRQTEATRSQALMGREWCMRSAAAVWRGTAAFTAEQQKPTGPTGLMVGSPTAARLWR